MNKMARQINCKTGAFSNNMSSPWVQGINSDGLLEYSDTMDRNATILKQDAVANKLNTSQTVIETVQELIKNADALMIYIQENILPDYDKFVAAGAQYNDDAVYINGVVENFNAMSSDLHQRTEDIMDQIANISSRILQNKQVADALSEEAEHFVS